MNTRTTCHRDGTVTFWSVYQQEWIRRTSLVPDQELAAMSEQERAKAQRHLDQAPQDRS